MATRSIPRHGCEDVRDCPTCKSTVGRPCYAKSGRIVYAHKARRRAADPHESSHYRGGAVSHWFVSSGRGWSVGYELSEVLRRNREGDRSAYPNCAPLPTLIYRVPGAAEMPYQIRRFEPQVEGILFCGMDDISPEQAQGEAQ